MNKERWQQVNEIFHTALEHDTATREAYVRNATAGDDELLKEVQTLLTSHQKAPRFLDRPAWAVAPDLAYGDDRLHAHLEHRHQPERRHRAELSLWGDPGRGARCLGGRELRYRQPVPDADRARERDELADRAQPQWGLPK